MTLIFYKDIKRVDELEDYFLNEFIHHELSLGKQIIDDYISTSKKNNYNSELSSSMIDLGELAYSIQTPLTDFSKDVNDKLDNGNYQSIALARSNSKEFSKESGIPELKITTRDEPDYDKLMKWRLGILKEHGLGLKEIQDVIATIDPLPGAKEFLDELRKDMQVIIISDTFTQFAMPLMAKLGYPALFCNSLIVGEDGMIEDFKMRITDSKLTTVKALQSIGFETIASGDSYNDLAMIKASKAGFLFKSTEKIIADNPEIPAFENFDELLAAIKAVPDSN